MNPSYDEYLYHRVDEFMSGDWCAEDEEKSLDEQIEDFDARNEGPEYEPDDDC